MPFEERLTFDPLLRKNGIPENVPKTPVGAVDEAEALELNTLAYSTCSKPVPGVNRGCQHFYRCPFSYKGKPSSEGGGPRRHAFEVAMPGQPINRWESECFDVVTRIEDIEDNGGAVRVIADESETYEKVEGIYIKTFVDDTGETRKVPAKEGEYHYPNVARGDMLVTKTVVPFVRPDENRDIATDIVTARVVAKEQERIRGKSFPEALGIDAGSTPLDKRNSRGVRGKAKSE